MSNLNEQDIAKWTEKQERKGLFQVEEVEIEEYDDNGELVEPAKTWFAVTSKINNTGECYECRNENVANELCSHLNTLTQDFMFNKTLPEQMLLKDGTEIFDLGTIINVKHIKLEELARAIEHELSCELSYIHRSNSIRLYPEKIKDELGLNKLLTEKQTQAYIEEKLSFEFDMWKIAKSNTSLIRQQLDYINDRVSFEKYALRARWIK